MRITMKIGVLAVQGAFIEHEHMIEKIGHTAIEIRQKDDLKGLDGNEETCYIRSGWNIA